MDCSTRPSNVRVYQFHHFGTVNIRYEYYYNFAGVCKRMQGRKELYGGTVPATRTESGEIRIWPAVSG